jgi:hypothetical protein
LKHIRPNVRLLKLNQKCLKGFSIFCTSSFSHLFDLSAFAYLEGAGSVAVERKRGKT